MAGLQVFLLGGFQAHLSPGRPLAFHAKKAQALVAVLAVRPGERHTRQKLAALLWGDTSDKQAANSLRQTLFMLRKTLAGTSSALVETDRAIAFMADAIDVDVVSFERLVAEGTPDALERATELYRGDFLDGLDVNEAPFEEWLRTERERLREQAVEAFARLLAHHVNACDWTHAIGTATRLLGIDPAQEPVHRALMRVYARQGRRASALRQYELCVAVLQRELGAEPEAETKQLYRELLRRVEADPEPPRSRADAPRETSVVGRDGELAQLHEIAGRLWHERGHAVAIVGEAGIGKSSLAGAVADAAHTRGGRVLFGRAHQSEQVLAFGPWLDALRSGQVVGDLDTLVALPPVWRTQLARLLPEVGTHGPESHAPGDDAAMLFESIRQLLLALASREPVVVILEDLHWADDMSLRLLAFLGRRVDDARVLIVFTAREEEIASTPMLARVLEELTREPHVVLVKLLPLTRTDTTALIRRLARAGSDPKTLGALEERIWSLSNGNPFVVVEAMRAHVEGTAVENSALPQRVRDVIAERLDRLSPSGRQLLDVAAVMGRACEFGVLQRAGGLDDEDTAGAIEELVRKRVLGEVGGHFDFLHDRIRDVAYGELLPPRLTILHARVAESIETLHSTRLEEVADRLARHYAEAGNPSKTIDYLSLMAQRAVRTLAYEESAAALRLALHHVATLAPDEQDRRRPGLILGLGESLDFLGQVQDALHVLREELPRVERLGDVSLTGRYHFALGRYAGLVGERTQAIAHARRALADGAQCGDHVIVGKSHFLLSMEDFWAGRMDEGVEHGRKAAELLEASAELWWAAMAHWILGLNSGLRGDFKSGLAAAARVEAIGRTTGIDRLTSIGAWIRAWLLVRLGDSGAVGMARLAVDKASDPSNMARALSVLGYALVEQGEAQEGIQVLERALGLVRVPQLRGWFMTWMSEGYLRIGDLAAARRWAQEGLTIANNVDFPYGVAFAHRALGRLACREENGEEAQRELHQALSVFGSIGAMFERGRTGLDLADAARLRGDSGAAASYLVEARQTFEALELPAFVDRVDRLAAAL